MWEQVNYTPVNIHKKKKIHQSKMMTDEYGNVVPKPHAAWGVVPVAAAIATLASQHQDT